MASLNESRLLALPPEIREEIYRLILSPAANRVDRESDRDYSDYSYASGLVLFRVSRQVYHESRRVFRDLNVFVRISTPWPEAEEHVAIAGHVPVLMRGDRAARFAEHRLSVSIESPHMAEVMNGHQQPPQVFVILVDDLPSFTQVWLYSDLSNPGLNGYLSLKMYLRDPYTPGWDEKHMSRALQRRLLLPFGAVKGLGGLEVAGEPRPLPSVVAELKEAQARPVASPEACLSEATRLKGEGNAALRRGDHREALRLYEAAWLAMHIVVRGRKRHVHAEAFFRRRLTGEGEEGGAEGSNTSSWRDKDGQFERLMLRIHLVANTCQAYLLLREWDEAKFWGERTIHMMRQSALGPAEDDWEDVPPEHEAITGFAAAPQMGKIYFRTAVACRELGDRHAAWKLLRVAVQYLPDDLLVKKVLAECAPLLA